MKIILTGLGVLFFVMAGNASEASARGKGDQMGRLSEELKLSPEQKEKMKELREKSKTQREAKRSEMKALRKSMKQKRNELTSAMESDESDSALRNRFSELEKLQQKARHMREARSKARFENALEVRKILTPEQRKEFRGFMHERKKGHGKKGRHHRGGGADDGDEQESFGDE